jgi:hypothetical protein
MELDLTTEQRRFRDDLRGYLAKLMTPALVHELTTSLEGGGTNEVQRDIIAMAGLGMPHYKD